MKLNKLARSKHFKLLNLYCRSLEHDIYIRDREADFEARKQRCNDFTNECKKCGIDEYQVKKEFDMHQYSKWIARG